MAYNFSANQFEDGYQAKRLRNWEVPKWFPAQPRTPHTTTKFIADCRGHLLPGVPKTNPWGTYKGTWELPHRITKSYAEEINAPPDKFQSLWTKRRAPSCVQQQIAQSEPEKLPVLHPTSVESFGRRNKSSSALEARSPTPSKVKPLQPLPVQQSTPNISPGTLDKPIKDILEACEKIVEKPESPVLCRAIEVLQKSDYLADEVDKTEGEKEERVMVREKKFGGALMNDYSSFQIAKRYHDENLKHQPLPDVVDDPVFKALASNKHPFPGKALNIQPNAAAIGWKSSGGPGPTKCSKVKVYRPKTAAVTAKPVKQEGRPKTCEPQKDKRLGPIDLAICWDLAPGERPRRGQHIDGSQGGEAPAVFAVVKPEDREVYVTGSAQAVATHVAMSVEDDNVGTLPPKIGEKLNHNTNKVINKSAIMSQVKPIESSPVTSFHSLSPESAQIARKNPKTAWTNYDTSKELSYRLEELENCSHAQRKSSDAGIEPTSSELTKKKMHRSSPNLSSNKKKCDGSQCGTESDDERKSKESQQSDSDKKSKDSKEYKMAFKAGMPNNGHVHTPPQPKPVKVPKMRPPYAKKNYAISTLIPPFSLWPDHNGQEYPEHWRLASVYQHSFKPVVARRKPLLASVFQ